MPRKSKHITDMMRGGQLHPVTNTFIDAYNHVQRYGIAGTIKCNIDTSNLYYVTVKVKKKDSDSAL